MQEADPEGEHTSEQQDPEPPDVSSLIASNRASNIGTSNSAIQVRASDRDELP